MTESKELKGFKGYQIFKDWKIVAKSYEVKREWKGNYFFPEKTVKHTLDRQTWYVKVMMRNNKGKRCNLLLHRVLFCTFNNMKYTDKTVVICHLNDDRTNNGLDNLYAGTQKDNMDDVKLKNWLLGLYRAGKLTIN